jgi:hypothetical protein
MDASELNPCIELTAENFFDMSVFRTDRRSIECQALHDDIAASQHSLSGHQYTVLFWYKCCFKDATLAECAEFLRIVTNLTVSRSTIYKALARLGFQYKHVKYISKYLDEPDRVAFWVNPVDHPLRPGVFLVDYLDFVDLDESGYVSSARRGGGHALGNVEASLIGDKPRTIPHYSLLVAIDARVGVINKLFYPHGTTSEVFYHFVVYMLIPSLKGTGRRVITMDRLNSQKRSC